MPRCNKKRYQQTNQCGEQPSDTSEPEVLHAELAFRELVQDNARDQEAGDDKENVHARKPTLEPAFKVEQHDRDDGDSTQPIHLWPVRETREGGRGSIIIFVRRRHGCTCNALLCVDRIQKRNKLCFGDCRVRDDGGRFSNRLGICFLSCSIAANFWRLPCQFQGPSRTGRASSGRALPVEKRGGGSSLSFNFFIVYFLPYVMYKEQKSVAVRRESDGILSAAHPPDRPQHQLPQSRFNA